MQLIPGKLYKVNIPFWSARYTLTIPHQSPIFISKGECVLCIKFDKHFNEVTGYKYETLVCLYHSELFIITRYLGEHAAYFEQV